MSDKTEVHILFDNTLKLAAEAEERRDLAVAKTIFDIMASSQNNVKVVTGAAKNSHFIIFGDASTKDAAKGATAEANPKAKFEPVFDPPKAGEAIVVVGVNYGASLELKIPYLAPAVEEHRAAFYKAMGQLAGGE